MKYSEYQPRPDLLKDRIILITVQVMESGELRPSVMLYTVQLWFCMVEP